MPIIIKNYQWKQSQDILVIRVPLRVVNTSKADIIISSRYVKIAYEKYFFEAILLAEIDVDKSSCSFAETEIIFNLKKLENNHWESIEPKISKTEINDLRKKLLEEFFMSTQEKIKEKQNMKSELKRLAVRKQIETDTENRTEIESIRQQEKNKSLGDIEQWKNKYTRKKQEMEIKPRLAKKKEISEVSQPRSPKILQIEFTARSFPTPCRESKLEEENEWLVKQVEARRSTGFISEDIRPEERNPDFIKAKGDELLKNKNYLGAISAYTFGIKLSVNFVDFYISRAEAHLALGNFCKVVRDCSKAIELLKPEVDANLHARAICTGRRGIALYKLDMQKQGLEEIYYSLVLEHNEEFDNFLKETNDIC